jgi:hypothetical protein
MAPASWPSFLRVLPARSLTPLKDPPIILPPGRRPLIADKAMLDHLTLAEASMAKNLNVKNKTTVQKNT